eukprot:12929930-Prorocentrum_lima.AAC.1
MRCAVSGCPEPTGGCLCCRCGFGLGAILGQVVAIVVVVSSSSFGSVEVIVVGWSALVVGLVVCPWSFI